MHKVMIIHGPNLNLLGLREKNIYGENSLEQINENIQKKASSLNIKAIFVQSNHEGEIVTLLHQAYSGQYDGVIINPAAYTHTSVAIRDAIAAIPIPAIEVHLSNTHARESFRQISYTAPVCIGRIEGFGANSYTLGIQAMYDYLER